MHTSKNEGMFTAERYQQEYLNSRKQFHNPTVFFKPSEETIQETPFHSSIIFDQDFVSKSIPSELSLTPSKKNNNGKSAEQTKQIEEIASASGGNDDYQYVIDESHDLEEMIAETKNTLSDN